MYLQWQGDQKWAIVLWAAQERGIRVVLDIPFVTGQHASDTYFRQEELTIERRIGVKGDNFNPLGQDWGQTTPDFEAQAKNNFQYLRMRARWYLERCGGARFDHVIGLYRVGWRPEHPWRTSDNLEDRVRYMKELLTYTPISDEAQVALGERLIDLHREEGFDSPGGPVMYVENLGTLDDHIRDSLLRKGVIGWKVLPFEAGYGHLKSTADFPVRSIASTATSDFFPTRRLWVTRPWVRQQAYEAYPAYRRVVGEQTERWSDAVRRGWLEASSDNPSQVSLNPYHDEFGLKKQSNVAGKDLPRNWTDALFVDRLLEDPETLRIAKEHRERAERYGRL
jgi:4-alpha-glucanotransferase